MRLSPDTMVYAPAAVFVDRQGDSVVLIDTQQPNWLATDTGGAAILQDFSGGERLGAVVARHARREELEYFQAWHEVDSLVSEAMRRGFLFENAPAAMAYGGREAHVESAVLTDLWIHTNNSCNLSCRHCLVSSGPGGEPGLPYERLSALIGEAADLGVTRFFFTGGEPFVREDFPQIAGRALDVAGAEVAVLSNGILLTPARLAKCRDFDHNRLRIQISLDGSKPEINDPIRGPRSFHKICEGIRTAVSAGFPVTITTAITDENAEDVPEVTRLAAQLGVANHHLLWLHKRGRAAANDADDRTPTVERVLEIVRRAHSVAKQVGITIDNVESIKSRVNVPRGVRRDLSSAAITSICVYSDGTIYPSPSMANVPELAIGRYESGRLADVMAASEVARVFRKTSLENKPECPRCPIRYLCGGGDIEHAYFYGGSLGAHDPYCEVHKAMILDALHERALERKQTLGYLRSREGSPVLMTSMGDASVHCASEEGLSQVVLSGSECVRSFDLDRPRSVVEEFYSDAAADPKEDLCCPVKPKPEDVSHIPQDVIDRYYGCGSPIDRADVQLGEVTLDLGSGAGIDVLTCARKVGPKGRAIGVDMTDRMLTIAREAARTVASNLGFDVVTFRKGYLEEIPAEDGEVDLVTSNCVINLSPDKRKVFSEIRRVLKHRGRIVISDIVAEKPVPIAQRLNPRLWGECISGALTEEELLACFEQTGFEGMTRLSKEFWREVEGHRFYSVTLRAYKFDQTAAGKMNGAVAIYRGPFKCTVDDLGNLYPRGVAVSVTTDTAARLRMAPYRESFDVNDGSDSDGCCGTSCC